MLESHENASQFVKVVQGQGTSLSRFSMLSRLVVKVKVPVFQGGMLAVARDVD